MVTTDTEHRSRGATTRELPDRVGESLRRAGPRQGRHLVNDVISDPIRLIDLNGRVVGVIRR